MKYYAVGSCKPGTHIPELCAAYPKLIKYAQESGSIRNEVARVIMDYIRSGKNILMLSDLIKQPGPDYKQLHNALRPFFRMGLLTRMGRDKGYMINVGGKPQMQTEAASETQYSPDILEMIEKLASSPISQKDRRIARIIRKCLAKGNVTRDDYSAEGELSKWHTDTRFAAQLGLLERGQQQRIQGYCGK